MIKNIIFDIGNVLLKFEPKIYLTNLFENKEIETLLFNEIFQSEEWVLLDRGSLTDEDAISIFVGSRLSGVPYAELVKPMLIFLFIVGLPVLFLTTYFPVLSCWLPTVVVGAKIVGPW